MSILKESIFYRFLLFLRTAWQESRLCRFFLAFGEALARVSEGSAVWRFIRRDGVLPSAWPESFTCRALTRLFSLPSALLGRLHDCRGGAVWEGSVLCRALTRIGSGSALSLGLFLGLLCVFPHEIWNNLYALILTAVLLLCFLFAGGARQRERLRPDELGPYLFLFAVFLVYALVSSSFIDLSVRFFLFHCTAFFIVLLTVSSVHTADDLFRLITPPAAGITIASLYSFYQRAMGIEAVGTLQDMTLNVGMPGRVFSFFNNPNNFAELLVLLVPLLLVLLLCARTWRGKALAAVSFAICCAALAMTYSRSGWIGFVLALMVFLFLENWRLLPPVILLGICCLPLLPSTIWHRILTIGQAKQDSSMQYRAYIFECSKRLLRDFPITGVGLGSDVTNRIFQTYPAIPGGSYPVHMHNNLLQIWGETGIFGALACLSMLLWRVKSGIRSFYDCTDRRVRHVLAASVGSLCGILLISLAEYTWFYPRNLFLFWFLFGLTGACVKLIREGENA